MALPAIISGEGKPLVLLHGYLSNKECFARQIAHFSKYYKVVAPDLPGFGECAEPPFAYSLGDYAERVAELIDGLGGKADVVAHSFGGRIAVKIAAERPNKIGRLVLVGAAGIKPKRKLSYYIKVGGYKLAKKISANFAERLAKRTASPDYLALSPLMRESFKKIIAEHLDGAARLVKAPTLLVYGENDSETPLYMAKKYNKYIEGSGLVVMKDAGHFCFAERPYAFNLIAGEFLLAK